MDISSQILSDIEHDKLVKFAEDTVMVNAVKKYVLAVLYKHGVPSKGNEYAGNINWALAMAWGATESSGMPRSDEELGQNLRALTYGTKLVETGFKEISEMKDIEDAKKVEPLPESNPTE